MEMDHSYFLFCIRFSRLQIRSADLPGMFVGFDFLHLLSEMSVRIGPNMGGRASDIIVRFPTTADM
jgi:hypothetical protein